jgi:hypothetical protein
MNVKEITDLRLADWTQRLVAENSTPLLMLGIGHEEKSGQFTLLTVEDEAVDTDTLIGLLKYCLKELEQQQRRN